MILHEVLLLTVCTTVSFPHLLQANDDLSAFQFNRDHIEVLFSTYVPHSNWDSWYKEQDLEKVLQHISKRFTKLVPPVLRPQHWRGSSRVLLPTAVAHHNLNLTLSGDSTPLLDLSMEFARHIYDKEMRNGTSLDIVLHYSDKANDIKEGTVKTLMLQYGGLHEDSGRSPQDALKETLASAVKINASTKYQYEFGAMFHTADCELEEVERHLAPIMRHLVLIQFDKWPEQKHFDQGVEASLPEFIEEFEKCLKNVPKVNPEIRIGFRTRWDDKSPKGVTTDVESKRKFWVEVAKWAVERNTSVVFHGAFDTPGNWQEEVRAKETPPVWLSDDNVSTTTNRPEVIQTNSELPDVVFWNNAALFMILLTALCVPAIIIGYIIRWKQTRSEKGLAATLRKLELEAFVSGGADLGFEKEKDSQGNQLRPGEFRIVLKGSSKEAAACLHLFRPRKESRSNLPDISKVVYK